MKYCRDCRRLWPAEALFCGSCKRTFGGRRCEVGHLSPSTALYCTTCGRRKLSQAAHYTGLSLPVRIVACVAGLIFFKVVFANLWSILGFAFASLGAAASFVVGEPVGHLVGGLLQMAVVLTLIWIALRRIIGWDSRVVTSIERLGWNFLLATGRAGVRLARAFLVWATSKTPNGSKGSGPSK